MTEKALNAVHGAQQKRDAYGFALRPQHIQRYREYAGIYKEEEEERAEKWKTFLEQQEISEESYSSSEELQYVEHTEDTHSKDVKSLNNFNGDNDSRKESFHSNRSTGHEPEKGLHLQKENAPDRNIELADEGEPGKEVHSSEERDPGMEEQLVEEGGPDYSLQLPRECDCRREVPLQEETKTKKTKKWANVRPCLAAIEARMSSRVKKAKHAESGQSTDTSDHLQTINEAPSFRGESDEDYVANPCTNGSFLDVCVSSQKNPQKDVNPELLFPWTEELEALVRLGVPKDLRGEVWQAFVGVNARRVKSYYQGLLSQVTNFDESNQHANLSGAFRKWRKQIEKDIPRTFPGHPALVDDSRESLRRILLAYACHNPSVGYCQAMNFFAGLLLLLMPEENAFWTLVGIIDDYFDGYYTEEMIESQVDQLVFEELMRERFPKLVNHLDYLGVQVAWISGPWFLSIFVNMLPWESVLRIWDVLLFEGNRVMLFRAGLALMELYGPALVTTEDAGDAITLLQNLSGSTFDSSQLVLTACMGYLAITEARLQELREKHRPSVLMVVEERRRGRIWKDSKGLASKLYSFKHDRGPIAEVGRKLENEAADEENSNLEPRSSKLGELFDGINGDSETDSIPDLQEQVVWLKVELCRVLEEKRAAVLRAEELETALMEMVKEDNRRQLSARIEQLEQEVAELKQLLADKKEQETAMLQVLMRVEQEQKLTEDARRSAEQDAAAQRYALEILQEKYDKAAAEITQMEKRVVMAESMLEATLQYQSGQSKALASPRLKHNQIPPAQDSPRRRVGLLSLGFGWRERNKGKQSEESSDNKSYNVSVVSNSAFQASAPR